MGIGKKTYSPNKKTRGKERKEAKERKGKTDEKRPIKDTGGVRPAPTCPQRPAHSSPRAGLDEKKYVDIQSN